MINQNLLNSLLESFVSSLSILSLFVFGQQMNPDCHQSALRVRNIME